MRTKSNHVNSSKRHWYIEQEVVVLSVNRILSWVVVSVQLTCTVFVILLISKPTCISRRFVCMPPSMIQLNWLCPLISAFNGALINCIVCVSTLSYPQLIQIMIRGIERNQLPNNNAQCNFKDDLTLSWLIYQIHISCNLTHQYPWLKVQALVIPAEVLKRNKSRLKFFHTILSGLHKTSSNVLLHLNFTLLITSLDNQ